ncbi:hypothetical protein [Pannonibacter indicus]|uniref:hypothetical protein n=1 Tax=Pannonibacter indicus TaxID=466044 RepID=UPI00391B1276
MHADDLPVTEALSHALLTWQARQWAHLPVSRMASTGTDNALYRIGNGLVLRIPRLRHRGHAGPEMGCEFGIFDWREGEVATPQNIASVTERGGLCGGGPQNTRISSSALLA